jgi:hypothetical protein
VAYAGNLRQFHLGDILRLIGDGLRRGRLVVERGGLRADLYFENGFLLHVWRSGPTPALAQRFVAARLLTPQQIAGISAVVGIDPAQLADAQLVQIAIEQGMIMGDQLNEWTLRDVVDLLAVLFSWRDGDYRFEEGLTPPPSRLRVALPIQSVLGMVMQGLNPWQGATTAIAVGLDDVLDFAEFDSNDPQPIQLSRDQWRLLTLVDGENSLRALAEYLASVAIGNAEADAQRYYVELRRAEELFVRVASELLADGVAVVAGHAAG